MEFSFSLSNMVDNVVQNYIRGALEALPAILMAVAVFALFYILSRFVRDGAKKLTRAATHDSSLESLAGTVARAAMILAGVFFSATLVFPGLQIGDLVGVLGLTSVAVGFAFKDIFQNFLAGVIILLRRPFSIGDTIETSNSIGVVEDINIRSTSLRTPNGEQVITPNSEILTNPVKVLTAHDVRRSIFETGIGYEDDIDSARSIALAAVRSCPSVVSSPEPRIDVVSHGADAVGLEIVYWTKSDIPSWRQARTEVVTAVKNVFDDEGFDMPFPQRELRISPHNDIPSMMRDIQHDDDSTNDSAKTAYAN